MKYNMNKWYLVSWDEETGEPYIILQRVTKREADKKASDQCETIHEDELAWYGLSEDDMLGI